MRRPAEGQYELDIKPAGRTVKHYSAATKQAALNDVFVGGMAVKDAATRRGVHENTLHKWVRKDYRYHKDFEAELRVRAGVVAEWRLPIGQRIRRCREQEGDTLSWLALAVGIGQDALNRYENGWEIPPQSLCDKIADALDVDRERLILKDVELSAFGEEKIG